MEVREERNEVRNGVEKKRRVVPLFFKRVEYCGPPEKVAKHTGALRSWVRKSRPTHAFETRKTTTRVTVHEAYVCAGVYRTGRKAPLVVQRTPCGTYA